MTSRRNLLWFDCSAGALVGMVVLLIDGWLSSVYQLPRGLVFFMGIMNLVYASYSFSLARRSSRPLALIQFLAIANMLWGVLLFYWVFLYWDSASFWGLAYLVLEAVFVGGLGVVEWRSRESLLTKQSV